MTEESGLPGAITTEQEADLEEAKRQWCMRKLAERKARSRKRVNWKKRNSGRLSGGVAKRHRPETDYLVANMVSAPNFHKEVEGGNIFGLETDPSDKGVQVPAQSAVQPQPESSSALNEEIKAWREKKLKEIYEKKRKRQMAQKKRQENQKGTAPLNKSNEPHLRKESNTVPDYKSGHLNT